MIPERKFSLKKVSLCALIGVCGIAVVGLAFVSVVSIWIGCVHWQKDGAWMPIVIGTLLFLVGGFFCVCAIKRILLHMTEEDVLRK